MQRKTRTMPFLVALGALLVALGPDTAAHPDSAYWHPPLPFSPSTTYPDWMASIRDDTPLSMLSLPGTHDSGALTTGGDIGITQSMLISQQLEAGIRAFDIRLGNGDLFCQASGGFYIYHGSFCQNLQFQAGVLSPMTDFLASHPDEAIVMRIRQEHYTAADFATRVVSELTPYVSYLYFGGSPNPELWEMRGKIVILQNFGTMGQLASVTTAINYLSIDWQDDSYLATNWHLADKWHNIQDQFAEADLGDSDQIYGNFLSGSGGSLPYFVASGHSDPANDAPHLITGWTSGIIDTCDGDARCIDEYPRVACFLGTCTVVFEGTNILARDYIQRSDLLRTGIVFADFPGSGLIGAIIAVNFATVTVVTAPEGAVFDGSPKAVIARTLNVNGTEIAIPAVNYAGLIGCPAYPPSATPPTAAGCYAAFAGFPGDGTYRPSQGSADFTIARAPSVTTVMVDNVFYNGQPRGGTAAATGVGGLIEGLAVSYSGRNGTSYGPSAIAPTLAGDYTASASYPGDANHTASQGSTDFTIARATLVVKADDQSRPYGAANPPLTGTLAGVATGDGITASYSTTATAASPAGTYAIVPALADPQGKLANYAVISINGTLSVTGAVLTVTADNMTRAYGAANPPLTASYSGFVNGETLATSGVSGAPILITTATTGSGVGSYPIVVAQGTLAASNYSFTFVAGTLSVTKSPLTVQANDFTRVYGDFNPAFTATASGLVNGDTLASIGIACASAATPASPVGTYAITCLGAPANYTVAFEPGTLTVTKAPTALVITSAGALALDAQGRVTVTARLTWHNGADPLAGKTIAFGAGSVSAVGTTDANGVATALLALPSEEYTLNPSFAGDTNYLPSQAAARPVVVYLQSQFVIWGGNTPNLADTITVGQSYQFWDSQWAKQVSGGDYDANNSFKGYANVVSADGQTWTSDPGNASGPPATVPRYIGVIVTTSVTRDGSIISGNIAQLIVLRVDAPESYQPSPGHVGSGVLVAILP